MVLKAVGHAVITGTLHLRSGLHIGAGKETIEIGGIDNPVVKHPHSKEPYVPGSSLKGKLRFLLEWAFGKVREDGQPWGIDPRSNQTSEPDDAILRIFGTAAKRDVWAGGPTRLVVRDAPLSRDWVKRALDEGLDLTEEKIEVVIDRIAGKALEAGLRRTERVPAGAEFELEMVFRLYDTGDGGARDKACLNWLIAGLGLLEQDALGGSGSRGYGRVEFRDLKVRLPSGEEREIGTRHRVNRVDPNAAPSILAF
jgi:CRISPR-associated protein Csm3